MTYVGEERYRLAERIWREEAKHGKFVDAEVEAVETPDGMAVTVWTLAATLVVNRIWTYEDWQRWKVEAALMEMGR